MTVRLIHPEGVVRADVHHQVSLATLGTGSTVVSMAGQVSWDADGQLVGEGDLAAQTEQAYLNVAACLRAAGATFDDVTSLTVYVVGLDAAKTGLVMEGRERAATKLSVTLQQPGTYVGVTSLFDPAYLIEVQATAVLGS